MINRRDFRDRPAGVALLATVLITAWTAACAQRTAPETGPPSTTTIQTRRLDVVEPPPHFDGTGSGPHQLEERLHLAFLLYDAGQYSQAAISLRQLARDQPNHFGNTLLASAASAFLRADDRREFSDTMNELDQRLGLVGRLTAPVAIRVLFALDAHFRGGTEPSPEVLDSILPR